jgi:hypothetical protein
VTRHKSFQAGAKNAEARSAEVISVGGSLQTATPETKKCGNPSWRDGNEERPVGDVRPSAGLSVP